MGVVRVGTSGWQYDHWNGRFYPDDVPKSRWFEYYLQRFPTVEINYSFYRLPRVSTTQKWHDRAPDLFRYAAKEAATSPTTSSSRMRRKPSATSCSGSHP